MAVKLPLPGYSSILVPFLFWRVLPFRNSCRSSHVLRLSGLLALCVLPPLLYARRDRTWIDSPQAIAALCSEMRFLSHESLRVVLLNAKQHLIKVVSVSEGTLNEAVAHPREIFKSAIIHSAYGFVLAHNLWVATHKLCGLNGYVIRTWLSGSCSQFSLVRFNQLLNITRAWTTMKELGCCAARMGRASQFLQRNNSLAWIHSAIVWEGTVHA